MFYTPEDYTIADSEELELIEYFNSKVQNMVYCHQSDFHTPRFQPEFMFEAYGPYILLEESEARASYVLPALVHEISNDLCKEIKRFVKGRRANDPIHGYIASNWYEIYRRLGIYNDNPEIPDSLIHRSTKQVFVIVREQRLIYNNLVFRWFFLGVKFHGLYFARCSIQI